MPIGSPLHGHVGVLGQDVAAAVVDAEEEAAGQPGDGCAAQGLVEGGDRFVNAAVSADAPGQGSR